MLKLKESDEAKRAVIKPFKHKGITIVTCAELKLCLGVEIRKGNNRKPLCHPLLFTRGKRHLVELFNVGGNIYAYGRNKRFAPTGALWIPSMRSGECYVNHNVEFLISNLGALGFDPDAVRRVVALTNRKRG